MLNKLYDCLQGSASEATLVSLLAPRNSALVNVKENNPGMTDAEILNWQTGGLCF
jgi:hypothetical protein